MTKTYRPIRMDRALDQYIQQLRRTRKLDSYSESIRAIISEHRERLGL